jgi:hypothetical protein
LTETKGKQSGNKQKAKKNEVTQDIEEKNEKK